MRVRFATGREVVTTVHHKFLMPDGWREARSIEVEETAALPARIPFPTEPRALLEAELDLLAVLLAEGLCHEGQVAFSTTDKEVLARTTAAANVLGMRLSPKRAALAEGSANAASAARENLYEYYVRGRMPTPEPATDEDDPCACGCGEPVGENFPSAFRRRHAWRRSLPLAFTRRYGIHGTLSKDKRMPEAVFRLPASQLGRFLATFFMCDGTVSRYAGPGITLASEGLVRDVQHLLLRFGIQSRVAYKPASCGGKRFPSWRLTVYSAFWPSFAENIPLWGAKRQRLETLLTGANNPNVGAPTFPAGLRRELRSLWASGVRRPRGSGPTLTEVGERLGYSNRFQFDLLGNRSGNLAMRPFEAFCEVYGLSEEHGWLYDTDSEIFWDRIVGIEDAGDRKVYGLSVEPTRCFVAGDVIVHNTFLAVNLAAALAKTSRPRGSEKGLNVLLVEQNYANSDVRTRVSTRPGNSRGLVEYVDDARSAADTDREAPDLGEYTSPVKGLDNLHVLFISGEESTWRHKGKVTTEDLDTVYEAAAGAGGEADPYDIVVVDLQNGLPQAGDLTAETISFWVSVADVMYLVLNPSEAVEHGSEFLDGAREIVERQRRENPNGAPSCSLVPVFNMWRPDSVAARRWESGTIALGADYAIAPEDYIPEEYARDALEGAFEDDYGFSGGIPHGLAQASYFHRIPADDAVHDFCLEKRLIALESRRFKEPFFLLAIDALTRIKTNNPSYFEGSPGGRKDQNLYTGEPSATDPGEEA